MKQAGRVVGWGALEELARGQGLVVGAPELGRLDTYLAELMRWRRAVNLVGPADAQRVADELIADAVPLAAALRAGDSLLDIGAGAGLPGLVVALLRADVRVELWEARERRCAFLRAAAQATGATNVSVAQRRAPEREPFERLPHHALSARAVWPPADWLRIAARLGQVGARVMLNASALPAPTGLRLEREVAYGVGALQRTLAVYEVTALG